MRAPKHHTNVPTRRRTVYLAPYQDEWVREQAEARYPHDVAQGPRSAVSRFLRLLVEREMEREEVSK